MTARARFFRIASAALTSALIAGAALMTSTGAMAVELNDSVAAQTSESTEAPAADAPEVPVTDESDPAANPEEEVPAAEDPVSSDDPVAVDEPEDTDPAVDPADEKTRDEIGDEESDQGAGSEASAPTVDQAGIEVADATLEWGVKSSFRNYIYNFAMFEGKSTLLGETVAQPVEKGEFVWSAGSGTASDDGSAADVSFGEGVGAHFQSHPMDDGAGGQAYALDLQFTNPHVVVTSATTGELYMDVVGREFVDTVTVGEEYVLDDVLLADLVLPAPTVADGEVTWAEAPATLTEDGSIAFGGFYGAGDVLDPLTFSTGAMEIVDPEPTPEPEAPTATETVVATSQSSITEGDEVVLTASVDPEDAAGTVQFLDSTAKVGDAVSVEGGSAALKTKALSVGQHSITAQFTPADAEAFAESTSDAASLTVAKKASTGPVDADVKGATLSWGVKTSFRNYIKGPIAQGDVNTVGNKVSESSDKSRFTWSGGAGSASTGGNAADVKFTGDGGVHFYGHHGILDFTLTNPRVVITSASTAELYIDSAGLEFKDTTQAGAPYDKKNIKIADLILPPDPTVSDNTFTWKNATATLTEDGNFVFGSGAFYEPGTELDPVTFSLPLDYDGEIIGGNRTATTTKLAASATEVNTGQTVTLTSTTSPAVDGTVTFRVPAAGIEKTVKAKNGKATLELSKLDAVVYSAQTTFLPANDTDYAHSNSNSVQITVNDPSKSGSTPVGNSPSSGQAAGSLSWGISSFFSAYTTEKSGTSACPTPSRHCAGGAIETTGVGAGWLFPQSEGSSWNTATQTGTVQYSGVVSFNGYGQTMFHVSNPSITVTGPTSATLSTGYSGSYGPSSVGLDLGSASKSVGANGEVTWSGVAVQGGLNGISAGQSSNFDSLSFTVGAASGVSYGSTAAGAATKKDRTAADTAPTTTGITILTDKKKITAGGRIQLEAPGFEAEDEGVLVVLYDADGTNPVVLDEEASANASGRVAWSGTLPKDIADEYIITLQGSIDAGAPIDVVDKETAKKAASAKALNAPTADNAQLAGVLGPDVSGIGGMATWEWWASAGGLAAIAACMTLLVLRQRKLAA